MPTWAAMLIGLGTIAVVFIAGVAFLLMLLDDFGPEKPLSEDPL